MVPVKPKSTGTWGLNISIIVYTEEYQSFNLFHIIRSFSISEMKEVHMQQALQTLEKKENVKDKY